MGKHQVIKLVSGLALLLALLAGGALDWGTHASHTSMVSAPSAHHVLADVDPVPPGH